MNEYYIHESDLYAAMDLLNKHNLPYELKANNRLSLNDIKKEEALRLLNKRQIDYKEI